MSAARDAYPIMLRTVAAGYDESERTWLDEEINAALAEIDELREANQRLRTAIYGTPHVTLNEGSSPMSADRMPYTVDYLRNRDGWVVRRCADQRYLCVRSAGAERTVGWTENERRALTTTQQAADALRLTLTELWRQRGAP